MIAAELDIFPRVLDHSAASILDNYFKDSIGSNISVKSVEKFLRHDRFEEVIGIVFEVLNPIWAKNYGSEDLESALEYLKNEHRTNVAVDSIRNGAFGFPTVDSLNGKILKPTIGCIYFDETSQLMKTWSGTEWENVC